MKKKYNKKKFKTKIFSLGPVTSTPLPIKISHPVNPVNSNTKTTKHYPITNIGSNEYYYGGPEFNMYLDTYNNVLTEHTK